MLTWLLVLDWRGCVDYTKYVISVRSDGYDRQHEDADRSNSVELGD